MKKLISLFTVALLFALSFGVNAQSNVGNYIYTNTTDPYVALTGDSTLFTGAFDDSNSGTFQMNFNFNFGNRTFNTMRVNTNGWIGFGAPTNTTNYSALAGATNNVIAGFNRDLVGTVVAGSKVSILRDGVAGSRIIKIQWLNISAYNGTSQFVPENGSCQIWLYEGTNVVEVRYGTFSVGARTVSTVAQAGLRSGSTAVDSVCATTGTTWPAAVKSNTSTAAITVSTTAVPDNGRLYRYAPPPPPIANDVGISAANFGAEVISEGKCYNFSATVKNFGTAAQTVIPVYYTIDGGSPVGPVSTVGPIAGGGGTENVTFSGALGYCGLTAGTHTFSIYTDLAPPTANRPPALFNLTVLAKITTLPYLQDWATVDGYSVLTTAVFGTTPLWTLNNATMGPNGVGTNPAVFANFFNGAAGRQEILRTREFDFTGVTDPILHFYVGYRTYTGLEPDRLEVVVSTDHGLTFFPASTAYNKTHLTNPSLATLIPASASFNPAAETNWRHETVDLSNVGNNANVVIGFTATSAFGNNCWIDDITVSDPSGLCSSIITPAPFTTSVCKVTLNFTATPTPGPIVGGTELDNQSSAPKTFDRSTSNLSSFPELVGDATVTSGITTDNPTGGTAYVTQYYNNNPGQVVNANPGNTNQNGSINTPDNVYWQNAHWFRVTYNGNDQTGYATYNISIDIADYGFNATAAAGIWILKRADQTSNWNVVTTTSVGTVITASGLTNFCDFAFGDVGGAQPVELASFVSSVNGNNVTLNWATTTETNNSGFDIERSSNGTWSKVGTVNGNGTTTSPQSYSFTDRNVASGNYSYRLKQIDFNGNFEYFNLNNEVNVGIPEKFELSQNYPNPFNPSTSINFNLPFDAKVSIKIFDLSGKEVATLVNGAITAGYHSVNFNASNLSSGVYFYRINAEGSGNNFVATKKMSLIK